jgi:hypothetical protein
LTKSTIDQHPNVRVAKQSPSLFKLLIESFDLRNVVINSKEQTSVDTAELNHLEATVIEAAIALILKLGDATFRPFFIRLVDWATESFDGKAKFSQARSITFFRLVGILLQRLKSLITSYMGYALELLSSILQVVTSAEGDSGILLTAVFHSLQLGFDHDQDGKCFQFSVPRTASLRLGIRIVLTCSFSRILAITISFLGRCFAIDCAIGPSSGWSAQQACDFGYHISRSRSVIQ